MANWFKSLSETQRWHTLVEAGKRALEEGGYRLERRPGRGRSSVWTARKGDCEELVAIKTTQDRWFAFAPAEDQWVTLGEVDLVVVVAVDEIDDPAAVEVFQFPAVEVRKRFDAAYAARIADGQQVPIGYGMWVALDVDPRGIAASVGSGLGSEYGPIATYDLKALVKPEREASAGDERPQSASELAPEPQRLTIAEAKMGLASTFAVRPEDIEIVIRG